MTPREKQIIDGYEAGQETEAIAEALNLSPRYVLQVKRNLLTPIGSEVTRNRQTAKASAMLRDAIRRAYPQGAPA